MKKQTGHIDWFIFLPIVGLLLFSIVIVYSASAPTAAERMHGVDTLFINQAIRVIISLVSLIIFSKIDYHIYQKLARPIMLLGIALLALVLIVGIKENGAKRWLDFGPFNFQPVEYVKFAIVIYFSALLVKKQKTIKSFQDGFLPFLVWIIVVCVLIALQPNYSNMLLIYLIAMVMLFVGNTNLIHWIATNVVALPVAVLLLFLKGYRTARIMAFFNSTAPQLTKTKYQSDQALIALGNGGIFGLGPGQSKQSYLFLPESYGDCIFAIIGEEYGFIGLLFIFIAFALIFIRGMQVAKNAPDIFGYMVSIGIILTLAIYLFINAAVNTGLLPTTGVPLPFLSYGGTAVIIYSAAVGILLNISAQANIYPLINSKKGTNAKIV